MRDSWSQLEGGKRTALPGALCVTQLVQCVSLPGSELCNEVVSVLFKNKYLHYF